MTKRKQFAKMEASENFDIKPLENLPVFFNYPNIFSVFI